MDAKTRQRIVTVLRRQGRHDLAVAFDPGRRRADKALRELNAAVGRVRNLMQNVPEARRYIAKLQDAVDRFEFFVETHRE